MPDASAPRSETDTSSAITRKFALRVIFVIAMVGLAWVMAQLSAIFLMAAGAIVVAVIIHLIADPLHQRFHLDKKLSVILAIGIILFILGGLGWVFGSQLAAQGATFLNELPRSSQQVREQIAGTPLGTMLEQAWTSAGEQAAMALSYVRGLVGNIVSSAVSFVVIIVSGIIIATQPIAYRDGLLLMVPKHRRGRLRSVMNACGYSLKGWMIGQLIAMLVVGVLVSLGLLLVGIPSWLVLGLLAGVAQFVPLVGPIASSIPGLIIAGSMGFGPFVWTLAVYFGVQQVESNFLTPYVMNRTAALPMVLTLFAILAFSTLLGPMGAIFATPITVILYVGAQMLYVEDSLGERLKVKGERKYAAPAGE